jgi:predicted nucleic acid-binding protein
LVIVDSSVWIDFYRGNATDEVKLLQKMIWRGGEVIVADLVAIEVLQGAGSDKELAKIRRDFSAFDQIAIVDTVCADAAVNNYRFLRSLGNTPRKTIDTLIATRCILNNIPLLTSDRDFEPFVEHLGLVLV